MHEILQRTDTLVLVSHIHWPSLVFVIILQKMTQKPGISAVAKTLPV